MITRPRRSFHRIGAAGFIAVVSIALFDLLLRAEPILTPTRALYTAGYDEGAYTASAGSLVTGAVPYRDFTFIQPPGIMLVVAPVAVVVRAFGSWSEVLVFGRWLVALVAIANVALVMSIGWRWKGWPAAVIGGILYASYLPAVHTENQILLDPLVVLCLLGSARLWIGSPSSPSRARTDARSLLAGGVAGLAAVIKLTGGIAVLALVLSERVRAPWRQRLLAMGSATGIVAVSLLPFAVLAGPRALFQQVVMTQYQRTGQANSTGGIVARLEHLGSYGPFALGGLGGSAGAVGAALAAALVVWAWWSGSSTGRFFAVAVAAGAIAILASPVYFQQYPVTVFAGIAVLAGGGASSAIDAISRRGQLTWALAVISIALCLAAGVGDSVTTVIQDARDRQVADPSASIRDATRSAECVSAELPEALLKVGRLPPRDSTGGRLPDPFAALLYEGLQHGHHTTTASALNSQAAQNRYRQALIACPYTLTIGPPLRLGSDTTRVWFANHFVPEVQNQAGLTLWRRVDRR
jgi:4-amino-4-deoxy-L-arabinose transferase-like glycosyltransferase